MPWTRDDGVYADMLEVDARMQCCFGLAWVCFFRFASSMDIPSSSALCYVGKGSSLVLQLHRLLYPR